MKKSRVALLDNIRQSCKIADGKTAEAIFKSVGITP